MTSRDPKTRFTAVADDYARYRPDYPAAAVEWIMERLGLAAGSRLVDLGCGTGIAARLFAARGLQVTAVDPNEEMLEKAREAAGGPRYLLGEAGATTLPDACADGALAAQAFHWFDLPRTQQELRRILKPGGRCAALWNLRASTPLLDAYEKLLRERSSEYASLRRPLQTIAELKELAGVSRVEENTFRHVLAADRRSFLGRARSSSYVAHGVSDRAAFDAALGALFDAHQKNGRVELAYDAVVLIFQP